MLEVTSSRMVLTCPPANNFQQANFPKLTASLVEKGDTTTVLVTGSQVGPMFPGVKELFTGYMGQLVNSASLRVQTNSIAINPTVAIGEGQGDAAPAGNDDCERSPVPTGTSQGVTDEWCTHR